jgi:diguanylate cyclase (GGDEF)-like protein
MNRRGFLKLGIIAKLTFIILVVSLLPLAFIGYQAYHQQRIIITKEVTASHRELSNTLANGIYENLEYTRALLTAISNLKAISNMDARVAEDFFNSLLTHFSIFRSIYLVDSKRKIVATTDINKKLPADWLYSNAIKRTYQGSLSEVKTSADKTLYITLEAIVRTPEQQGITGVLVTEVNLLNIREMLRKALKSSRSQGLVLDETGAIIARSSPETRVFDFATAEAVDSDITRLKTFNNEQFLITAVSLKKFDFYQAPNWTIILQIPEKEAFQAAYTFRRRLLQILGITAILSLLLAIFLAKGFTAPLANLITGAKQISAGDFSHHIAVTTDDEIGELTQNFNEMRVNLYNTKSDLDYRIMQLSTLYEVGKAISSELDFKKLQHMILEIVVKVINAEKGSLMLLDEAEQTLNIGVAVGLSEEVTKSTRLEIGESIAGYVVQTRHPLFIKDVESDQAFLALKKTNVKTGTLMCVPLLAKDKLLGALNVSDSKANTFAEKDFELFISLANQAAIAIENARLYRYAVTDEMTRIYNHRYFQQRLDEELMRATRYDNRISLLILDVDHFKNFNDTYGHPEGDRVLKMVAKLIERSVREVDIVARYGGEEFVVICPEKNGEGSLTPAERIRSSVAEYDFRINGKPAPITVSLGIACFPDQAKSKEELIQKADFALYYSKQHGRNRVSLFNPIMKDTDRN